MIALIFTGISERFFRERLEMYNIVVSGEIAGHEMYRCSGVRCANRKEYNVQPGSADFEESHRDCEKRIHRRPGCHRSIVVDFAFQGEAYQLNGDVGRREFLSLKRGEQIAVLVDPKAPAKSMLRDHNPDGFLFWVAVLLAGFCWFVFIAIRTVNNPNPYKL